jgi:drug/metabolite transporter (DMT)-like permease
MFGFLFTKKQIAGVLIGFIGSLILIIISAGLNPDDNYWYALLIILASIGYAFNVNILKKYLSDLDAMAIAVGNFLLVLIPALFVLWYSNFFKLDLIHDKSVYTAIGYISILAIVGTALAKVFFNRLVQISSPIFASSVTYLIPIIALFWGILDGEKIHLSQIMSGLTILIGVYLVNQKTTT